MKLIGLYQKNSNTKKRKKKMTRMFKINHQSVGVIFLSVIFSACAPTIVSKKENATVPASYNSSQDTTNTAKVQWKSYFTDPYLNALIDTALTNNQELNITLQEIVIANNEVRARKGEYLPFVD